MVLGRSFCRSRIHLPASLCSTPVTALPSSYGGSDFHRSVQRGSMDLPDSLHLNFSVVLSPTTRCLSMSAFVSLTCFRVLDLSPERRFPSARIRALGFAIRSQARQHIRPNRVSDVRTDRLASGCSPPHLRGPQLLIPFGDAVTFGFQPVERLVERDLTSSSDALSGARAQAATPAVPRTATSAAWNLDVSGRSLERRTQNAECRTLKMLNRKMTVSRAVRFVPVIAMHETVA
jgi:hypothetical protein